MNAIVVLAGLLLGQTGIAIDWEGHKTPRAGQVLFRACVSFEPGELARGSAMVLRDGSGSDVVADFVPTAFWRDGSIRILAVRASIAAHRSKGSIKLLPHRSPRPRGSVLSIDRRRNSVRVDTGFMSVAVDGDDAGFVTRVDWQKKEVEGLGRGLRLAARIDGVTFEPSRSLVGVDGGQAYATVRLTGRLIGSDSTLGPEYTLRLGFVAGSGLIGCRVRFSERDVEGVCSGVSVALRPPWTRGGAAVAVRAGGERLEKVLGPKETIKICSLPSRVEMIFREESTPLLTKGAARLRLKGCAPDFSILLPAFGRLHPWSLIVRQGGDVEISLLNEHFTWEPHVPFERRFVLGLPRSGRGIGMTDESLSTTAAFGLAHDVRRRSLIFADRPTAGRNDALADLFLEVSQILQNRLWREWSHWDGFMNYGDYRKSYGIWANQEYDPGFGLIKKFLWSNNGFDLEMARIALDHWLLFDRAAPGDPAASEGTPWIHGPDHRSRRTEPGHMWLDGLLAYYLLTGEKEYRDGAMKVGESLATALGGLKKTKLERNLAWTLVGLCALVEGGGERFETAMNQAAAWMRSRQLENGLMAFRETRIEEEKCLSVNTWVTGGITVEALYRHYKVTGDERSFGSAVRAMGALHRLARDTGKGIIYQTLVAAGSSGEIRSRKGRVSGGHAALFSLGAARAYEMTGEEKFRSCARSTLEKALLEIKQDIPEYVGEDLALILRSGPDVLAATTDR